MAIGLSLSSAGAAFAAISDRGTTWWSVEELLDFYQEVEKEKTNICGEDQNCRIEFGYNMIDRGPKYAALNNFLETQIWVTAVNPAKETVKVFYFDEDVMLKRMGIEEKIHLRELYMGWFNEWNAQIFNYDHEIFTNGDMADLHTIYDGNSGINGADWIPTWKEVELSVAGSNLIDNHSGILDYAVYAENNMFSAVGTFNYSDCLNAPDYIEGVECRLMFSGDQWATYFPPRVQISESIEELPIVTEIHGDVLEEKILKATENPPEETAAIISENDTTSKEEGIKAPNTGRSMSAANGSASPMPWWIIMMEVLGGILMLWWFIPVRNMKKRKKSKKHEKTVKNS